MIWLILAAYEIAALLTSRLMFAALHADLPPDSPVDDAMTGVLALFAGHFWPLALPVAIVVWKPRRTPDEVLEDNDRMQKRIAELERELGIGSQR